MPRFALDTNTCIDAIKGTYPGLAERFAAIRPDDVVVPAMVRAELLHGALRSREPRRVRAVVEAFLQPYAVIPFDGDAADQYAAIRHELESRGAVIGPNDLVIAATARARRVTLVTHNTREFGRVVGLAVEDWTLAPDA